MYIAAKLFSFLLMHLIFFFNASPYWSGWEQGDWAGKKGK